MPARAVSVVEQPDLCDLLKRTLLNGIETVCKPSYAFQRTHLPTITILPRKRHQAAIPKAVQLHQCPKALDGFRIRRLRRKAGFRGSASASSSRAIHQ